MDASIIVAKNDWYTGVAPDATLLSYKITTHVSSPAFPLTCMKNGGPNNAGVCRKASQTRKP